jgi:tetratricopeptide (TPR) repeat protein
MQPTLIKSAGIAWTLLYAAFIIWIYATAPRTFTEATTGASVVAGTYAIDEARFLAARELFRREQYAAARDEWRRADPAMHDARTQFYLAYAFYREGWGRVYHDDALYRQGLEAAERALALAPAGGGALAVDDPELKIHSAAELKAELQQGLETSAGDFNPLKIVRERK